MKKIKILISYHKPATLLSSNLFVPIHVGRDIATQASKDGKVKDKDYKWLLENMIGDNTGDNISKKNREYCELTALYWAWKNYDRVGNPDYIGFMTYRRHFIFNETLYKKIEKYLTVEEKTYSDIMLYNNISNYEKVFGITSDYITNSCNEYDCILPVEGEFKYIDIESLEEDYIKRIEGTHIEDYKLMLQTLLSLFPSYGEVAKKRAKNSKKRMYQMFICKKEIFFEYCEILFKTLEKLSPQIDTSSYSINGKRTLGYLGELIFDTYFSKLKDEGKYKIKEYPVTMKIDDNPIHCINKLKLLEYKILKDIAFSRKKRRHYRDKYNNYKRLEILQGDY